MSTAKNNKRSYFWTLCAFMHYINGHSEYWEGTCPSDTLCFLFDFVLT
jgi:hypothetical protein